MVPAVAARLRSEGHVCVLRCNEVVRSGMTGCWRALLLDAPVRWKSSVVTWSCTNLALTGLSYSKEKDVVSATRSHVVKPSHVPTQIIPVSRV